MSTYVLLLLLLLTSIVIYSFCNWVQFRDKLKPASIFDLSLVNLVVILLISRILGVMANFNTYVMNGWGLSPDLESNFRWYKLLPWNLFNVFDGGYFYGGLLLGLIFSTALVFVKASKNKSFLYMMDRLVISFSITVAANLIILVALRDSAINLYLPKNTASIQGFSIDTWVIQILILTLFLILTRIASSGKKLGLTTIMFELIFASGMILTDLLVSNELSLGLNKIIAFSFVIFSIIQYLQLHSKGDLSIASVARVRTDGRTELDKSPNQIMRDYSQSYRVMDQPSTNRRKLSLRDKFGIINRHRDRGTNVV